MVMLILTKNNQFGIKNLKALFDILGGYVVPADLSSLLRCMSAQSPVPQGFEG